MDQKTIPNQVLSILSLEDSINDFEIIHHLLTDAGYNIKMDRVENESDYKKALNSKNYSVILADFSLPGYNAFEALKSAIEICPEIPFICFSGAIGEETAIDLIKLGAVDYILKDKPGKLPYAINRALQVAKDITHRKQAEKELIAAKERAEESDRLKTSFLHNISHEIRTPMNAILGFSSLLAEPDRPKESQMMFIEVIRKSGKQLLSIIKDIVDIASIESNTTKLNIISVNLNATLSNLYNQFSEDAKEKGISLRNINSVPEEEIIFQTDKVKFIQIFSNLLNNALKFTKKGQVDFGYKLHSSSIEFFVADNGIGIPINQHTKIFNNFYQVDNGVSDLYGGTGLGLSISKAYCELLDGKIWLTSEPGKGSVFYFSLPYIPIIQTSIQESKASEIGNNTLLKGKTILVTEDNENNFLIISLFLKNLDINLIHAINGEEAISKCRSHQNIDLILMDMKMPVLDGYSATEQIREFLPDLPIIAQTAYIADRDKAFESGCNDFLNKPFSQEDLISIIYKNLKLK